jgi:hypothetical protein
MDLSNLHHSNSVAHANGLAQVHVQLATSTTSLSQRNTHAEQAFAAEPAPANAYSAMLMCLCAGGLFAYLHILQQGLGQVWHAV